MEMYLNQTATYEQRTPGGTMDIHGKVPYEPAKVVSCRRERITEELGDAAGRYADATHVYYLSRLMNPQLGDKLDGRQIVYTDDYVDGLGETLGWEVYA